jgi:hypothetical protein
MLNLLMAFGSVVSIRLLFAAGWGSEADLSFLID